MSDICLPARVPEAQAAPALTRLEIGEIYQGGPDATMHSLQKQAAVCPVKP